MDSTDCFPLKRLAISTFLLGLGKRFDINWADFVEEERNEIKYK